MPTRASIPGSAGTVLISSDLQGNLGDFLALRDLFVAGQERPDPYHWVGLGDWIHGPSRERRTRWAGEDLYRYPDESVAIVRLILELSRQYPDRFHSVLGNHEHSHIGGRVTQRYHEDEAGHLEELMGQETTAQLHGMLRSWPLLITVPACGVVLTHGAPPDELTGLEVIDDVRYSDSCPIDSARFLEEILWSYAFGPEGGRRFLDRIGAGDGSPGYDLIIHGHDRELSGGALDGPHGYLLCTSFGARRARKAYLTLDLGTRYRGPSDLREGVELHRLYPGTT